MSTNLIDNPEYIVLVSGGGTGAIELFRHSVAEAVDAQMPGSIVKILSTKPEGQGIWKTIQKPEYADVRKAGIGDLFEEIPDPRNTIGKDYLHRPDENAAFWNEHVASRVNPLTTICASGCIRVLAGDIIGPMEGRHRTINIHPGPTQEPYGGEGMHGHHVHEAIFKDWLAGGIHRSAMSMHYVIEGIDRGNIVAQMPVVLNSSCTDADKVGDAVNAAEHVFQWRVTGLVGTGQISWSGAEGDSVKFPDGYRHAEPVDLTSKTIDRPQFYGSNPQDFEFPEFHRA